MDKPSRQIVALSDTLLDSLWQLPRHIQTKVQRFIVRFRQNPDGRGQHRERIQGTRNLYSVRIDQQYRGIVAQGTDSGAVILLHVDNHDAAYAWARRHRCEVNPGSGTLQIFKTRIATEPAPVTQEPQVEQSPIAALRDRQLRHLGIPEALVPLARSVANAAEFEQVRDRFPSEAQDALYMLWAGYTFSEALEELALSRAEEQFDPQDLDSALQRTGTQAQFWVVEDEEELKRMLDAPQEKWRIFLHPSQRRLVDRVWNGPVRVLGGAGTGKTVVAMHRAKWLVANQVAAEQDRVLFLTFTANLAADLQHNLRSLIPQDALFQHLEVVHLDRWVYRFLRQQDFPQTIVYNTEDKRLQKPWRLAWQSRNPRLPLPLRFYQDEWHRVVLAQGISSRKEYLEISRTGRGTPLSRPWRAQIWPVFEAYRAQLRLSGLIEKEDAYRAVRQIVKARAVSLPYVAVVVDEAQDFGQEAFRLIHTLAQGTDQANSTEANRLFLVGDPHQRIYDRQVVLSRCGIRIRGRSARLRINYRTSEQILKTAVSVLQDMQVDNLDGGQDTHLGYRSLFRGPVPEFRNFTSRRQALQELIAWVEDLKTTRHLLYDDFCFVARTRALRDEWAEALHHQGLPICCLEGRVTDGVSQGSLRLATAHRVKGLEFSVVVILDADQEHFPLQRALSHVADHSERRQRLRQERSLLYVAMSRAKQHLMLCTRRSFSRFLPETVYAKSSLRAGDS